jgi:hypothetical protein
MYKVKSSNQGQSDAIFDKKLAILGSNDGFNSPAKVNTNACPFSLGNAFTTVEAYKSPRLQLMLGLAGNCTPPDFFPQYFTKAMFDGHWYPALYTALVSV